MPRTVVPPHYITTSPARVGPIGKDEEKAEVVGDKFPEKLAKYVPAETLAFFIPIAAFIGPERKELLIVVLLIAAIGTFGYLWKSGQSLPQDQRPLWHFYILAEIAFLCWAVATVPNVSALVGVDATVGGVILACAVFLVPLVDDVVTAKLMKPRTT